MYHIRRARGGINMKKYSMLHIPFMSFYSKSLYRDVAHNWKGTGLLYLLILLVICWLPTMAAMHSGLFGGSEKERTEVVSGHKPQYDKSGRSAYSQQSPSGHKRRGPSIVIDLPHGKEASPDRIAIHMFAAFMRLILSARDNPEGEPDLRVLFGMFDFDQTSQKKRVQQDVMSNYLLFMLYLLALAGSYVFRVLQVLVYAAIGQLFAAWAGAKLEYDALMRLSVVAITPVIIAAAILDAAGITIPFSWVWAFLCAMGYLYFGVRAAAGEGEGVNQESSTLR